MVAYNCDPIQPVQERFNIGENKALGEQTPHNYWKV
jgi:hypothetical protein